MRTLTLLCYVTVFTSMVIAYTYATVGGQYSVNVHFVPPLVTAPCQIAQFWTPSNVTCGLCFCMTGTLSRCIPQPGCNPNAPQNATTTTESSSSDGSTTTTGGTSPADSTTESATENPSSESSSPATEPPQGVPEKLRAAKPGKTRQRRRRHVGQSNVYNRASVSY